MNYSSFTTGPAPTLTLEKLEQAVSKLKALGPEPFDEWMRSQGHPPEYWTLVLPDKYRDAVLVPPYYVRFSPVLTQPVFIRSWRL